MTDRTLPAPRGRLKFRTVGAPPLRPSVRTVDDAVKASKMLTFGEAGRWARTNREDFERSLADMERFERGEGPWLGQLFLRTVGADGDVLDLGLVSCRVVTTAGAGFVVDAWQNLVQLPNMRYHGVGTGTAAEAVGNTALGAELTTQYSTSNTRPTGSLGEQSGNANVFETSATITVSAAVAVTEHGLLSQAAVGGGVLFDRSVFAAVNLGASESLQATYRCTIPSGG